MYVVCMLFVLCVLLMHVSPVHGLQVFGFAFDINENHKNSNVCTGG